MKKLMSIVVAILFAGAIWACNIPDGFTERQQVCVYTASGRVVQGGEFVYQSTNACDSYGICFHGRWYYVSKSDTDGFKYMFWDNGTPLYFNM